MITIHCSNPICGKSFLYDETKFPGAKKVQCPYCKTIQLLEAGEEASPFYEEPKEPEPQPQEFVATPVEQKGESFYSETATRQQEEPSKSPSKRNIWLILALVLIVAAVALVFILKPAKPAPLPPMPEYKLTVASDKQQVNTGESVVFSFAVSPQPDSVVVVRILAGGRQIAAGGTLDTTFNVEGSQMMASFLEVLRPADGALVRDTFVLSVNVVKPATTKPATSKSGEKEIVIDVIRQASRASWVAVYPKTPPAALPLKWGEPLKVSGDFYGEVRRASKVKMENGETRSGVELATGDKRNARIYGEFKVDKLPVEPRFSALLGYRDAKDSGTEKGEALFEFRVLMKDGTTKKIGEKTKKYNERFTQLEFFIDPADAAKIKAVRIDLVGNKRGIQRLVLMNARIAEK